MGGGPQLQRPEDADRASTTAMRELMQQAGALGPMIPRGPDQGSQTREAISRADAQTRPVVQQIESWAHSLEQRMPLDIPAARRQIGTLVPEGEREAYQGQIGVLTTLLAAAQRAQESGNTADRESSLNALRQGFDFFGMMFLADHRAAEIELPAEVRNAGRAGFLDFARGSNDEERHTFSQRGERTIRLLEFAVDHAETLERQEMAPARQVIHGYIIGLGTSATINSGNSAADAAAAREQLNRVDAGFTQVQSLVSNVETSGRALTIGALRDFREQMLAFQVRNETLRDEIQRMREYLEQVAGNLERDPSARLNEAETQKIEAQIAIFVDARDQLLAGLEGTPQGLQIEAMVGRALKAVREDHPDQAQLQLFLAGSYRGADATMRRELQNISEGLANGTMTTQQATARIGTYYTSQLTQLSGTGRGTIRDQETKDIIGRITQGMAGRTLNVTELARLAATLDIARDVQRFEDRYRNARGDTRTAADDAMAIYRRSLHTIEIGGPIGAAAMQKQLASSYMGANATMRENIRGISQRLENAENIRAMQGIVGDATDPAQIAAAARRVLGPNVAENDPRIAAMVNAFNQAGSNAQERMRFVQGVETEAQTFLQLMQRRDGIQGLLDRAIRQHVSDFEQRVYSRAMGALDGVLRSLGLGQQVTPQQLQNVQIQTAMLVGEPPVIQAAFATSQDPQQRQAQLQSADGLQSIQQTLGSIRSQSLRIIVSDIYGRGQQALADGHPDEAMAYFSLAQAAATSRSDEDLPRITSIVNRMRYGPNGEVRAPTPETISPEAGAWFGRHFLDRSAMQARISNAEQRRTYTNYMDLALRMHIDGDENGAAFMLNLATLYGRAAAVGGNDPQVRAALALPQGNQELGIPSQQSLMQEFTPYRVGIRGNLPAGGLFDELAPRTVPEGGTIRTFAQVLGAGETDSPSRIERLALGLVPIQLGVDQAEFSRSAIDPSARTSSARYTTERRRLEARLRGARDQLERDRLQRQIAMVDPSVLTQRSQRSTSDYSEGVRMMTQAADLRRQALDKNDEAARATDATQRTRLQGEARDLNARADALVQRAGVLMQAAQGLQGTVTGMHRSITSVLGTRHQENGRLELDSAAAGYIAAADEARRGDGPLQPGSVGLISARMQSSDQYRRLGTVLVAQQQGIMRQKAQMYEQLNRAHDRNVEGRDNSTEPDPDHPGQRRQIMMPTTNSDGRTVPGNTPAYDYDGVESRITRARGLVDAERLPEASRSISGITTVIQIYETRASIFGAYWSYLAGASDGEQSTGRLMYLHPSEMNSLFADDIAAADAGRVSEAQTTLFGIRGTFQMQSERQRHWNSGVLLDRLAGGVGDALDVADPGTEGYDPNNPRSIGYVPEAERTRDPRAYQAHMRNLAAVASTGIFGNIRRDREGARTDLRSAAQAQRDAAAAVMDTNDIVGGPGGLRQGLVGDIADAAARYDARQRGLSLLAPGAITERINGFVENGDTQGLLNYLHSRPALRDAVLSDLQERGVLSEAGATGLRADIQMGGTISDFQARSTGWNYSTMAAGRVLEFWDTVDQTTRAHSVDRQMRMAMRSNAMGLLGSAVWASRSPGAVPATLERGGTRLNVSPGEFVVQNSGDSVYDSWAMQGGNTNVDLIGSFRDMARAQLDILQSSAQGGATVNIPGIGRIPVQHAEAMRIADRETTLTFMTLNYYVEPSLSRATRIELNQAQLEVVQEGLQSVARARGEFLTTGATLKSWITTSERGRIYSALDDMTRDVMSHVDTAVGIRHRDDGGIIIMRRGRDNPYSNADRDAAVASIRSTTQTWTGTTQIIREGAAESERYWNYACTAAEMVGAGLVSLVPGGQIVVAGYFLSRGIESFEESRVGAGGWEQMTTTQQVLGVGGIALGALGFASAGGSILVREAALGLQEGAVLSRPILALSTATRYAGYTMMVGGVGLAGLTIYDMRSQYQDAIARGEHPGHEPDWLDYGFASFNAAMPFLIMGGQRIGMRYPSLMYSNGLGGYAFRGFMAAMGHSTAMASEESYIAAIEQASRARISIARTAPQAIPHIEASLGRVLEPQEVLALQQRYTVGSGRSARVEISDPVAAAALIDGYSRHYEGRLSTLSDDAHARLLTMQRDLGFGSDAAMALIDHYGNGITDISLADASSYVNRATTAGAREQSLMGRLSDDQKTRFNELTRSLETASGAPLRLDERIALLERFGSSIPDRAAAQTFLDGRRINPNDTVSSAPYGMGQYEQNEFARDSTAAVARMNSLARNEAAVVMDGVSEMRRGTDGTVTYVVGSGDHAVTVTQQQVSVASDTMSYAQRVMARPEGTPISEWLPQIRERILNEIKAQLRAEGVPATQIDSVAEARTAAAVRLATDAQFRSATTARVVAGQPHPMETMLGRAIEISRPVIEAEGQRRVSPLERERRSQIATARGATRDDTILRSDVIFNTFSGMRRTSGGGMEYVVGEGETATVYSQQHVSLASDFVAYGDRLVNRGDRSLTDVAAEVRNQIKQDLIRGGMDSAQADRVASERSRAILRLATDAEFRRASQGGTGADRGVMMRRALDASRDMVAEGQRPRALVPGQARPPPLPITDQTRADFRGRRAEYQDLGHPGFSDEGGVHRETYMFGGRSFEVQEGQDAANAAAAADLIVRRRQAGEAMTPDSTRQIARDLGVPERLLDRTTQLADNVDFQAAVSSNSADGRMRAALGMPREQPQVQQPPMPTRVREAFDASRREQLGTLRQDGAVYHADQTWTYQTATGPQQRTFSVTYTQEHAQNAAGVSSIADLVQRGQIPRDQIPATLRQAGIPQEMEGVVRALADNPQFVSADASARTRMALDATTQVQVQVEARGVAERYRSGDQGTVDAVNRVLGSAPRTDENIGRASAIVADQRIRPNGAQLGATGEGEFRTPPSDIILSDGRRVSVGGEMLNRPRVRILDVIDNDTGSAGGVYLAEIIGPDGATRRIAVKAYRGPYEGRSDQARIDSTRAIAEQVVARRARGETVTRADIEAQLHQAGDAQAIHAPTIERLASDPTFVNGDAQTRNTVATQTWREREWGFNYEARLSPESGAIDQINQLGLGIRGDGIVSIQGPDGQTHYGVGMEFVNAKDLADLNPDQFRRFVTPQTASQLRDQLTRLVQAGYTIDDFQYGVVTDPTPGRQVGDVVIWDLGGLRRLRPGEDGQAWINNEVARIDFLSAWTPLSDGYLNPRIERARTDPAEAQRLNEEMQYALPFFEWIGRTRPTDPNAPVTPERMVEAIRRTLLRRQDDQNQPVTTPRLVRDGVETIRQQNPQAAQRLEQIITQYEREAGLRPGQLIEPAVGQSQVPPVAMTGTDSTTAPVSGGGMVARPRLGGAAQDQVTARPQARGPPPPDELVTARPSPRVQPPPQGEGQVTARPGRRTPPPQEQVTARPGARVSPPPQERPTPQVEISRNEATLGVAADPRAGLSTTDRGRVDAMMRDVEGLSTNPAAAIGRLRVIDRTPDAVEVIDIVEGRFGMRGDISRAQAAQRHDALTETRDPRAQVVDAIFSDRRIEDILRRVGPQERAEIIEGLVRQGVGNTDEAIGHAYREIVRRRSSSPAELIRLADELSTSPARAFIEGGLRELGGNDMVQLIQMIAQAPTQVERERLAGWASTAITEGNRAASVREAERARSPQALATQERDLVRQMAVARGLDPQIAVEAFDQGGTAGRMQALDGFGYNMTRFRERQEQINGITDETRRRQAQSELDGSVRGFFNLVARGNLEGQVRQIPGFESASVRDVTPMGGLRGGYWVEFTNGRHLFIKLEDLEPAQLGMNLARNEGMLASDTRTADARGQRLQFDTGLRVDGHPVMQDFGIISDAHELAGTDTTIVLPDGRRSQVHVEGVVMLREEVFRNPNLNNPVTVEFYRQMATPEGRQSIMQAWRAYQELSRRIGLMDRHIRNTTVAMVTTPEGERVITFQPIDMDGIGYRIGDPSTPGGGLLPFNQDFASGTTDFMLQIANRSVEIGQDGLPRISTQPQNIGQIYSEMFGETASRGARLPPDPQDVAARRQQIFRDHAEAGRGIGLGFDATAPDAGAGIGAIVPLFGRDRPIERADGRVSAIADDAQPVFQMLADGRDAFIQHQEGAIEEQLARRVLNVANRVARGKATEADQNSFEFRIAQEIGERQEYRDLPLAQREGYVRREITRRLQEQRQVEGPEIHIEVASPSDVTPIQRPRSPSPRVEAPQDRTQHPVSMEAQVGNRVDEVIHVEMSNRGLSSTDQGIAVVRAQALTEAYTDPRGIDVTRARELGLNDNDINFLRVLHASQMEPQDAANEIAIYSARQVFESSLDNSLPGAISTRAREVNLNQAQQGLATVRAQQLSEAYIDFEAGTLTLQRSRELGITEQDRAFFGLVRDSQMSPEQAAEEIANRAVSQIQGGPGGGPQGPRGRGDGGGPQGDVTAVGRRGTRGEDGGGPRAQVIDLASRRAQGGAQGQAVQPGSIEAAGAPDLRDPMQLATFARRVLSGDTEAQGILSRLDQRIRDQVNGLTSRDAFRAASSSDSAFNNYVNRFGRRSLRQIASEIEGLSPRQEPQQQVVRRTGTDDAVVIGDQQQPHRPGEEVRPGAPAMIRQGDQAVAMGPRGARGAVVQGDVSVSGGSFESRAVEMGGPVVRREPTSVERDEARQISGDVLRLRTRRDELRAANAPSDQFSRELEAAVPDPTLREVVTQLLDRQSNDPAVARIIDEYLVARETLRRRDLSDAATAQHDQLALTQYVFNGQRNPTLDRIARIAEDNPAITVTADEARARLSQAFQRDGVSGLMDELATMHIRQEETVSALVLDGRMQQMLADTGPNSALTRMAAARGRDPAEFRREISEAYQRDGVHGVLDSMFGRQGGVDAAQSYQNRMDFAVDHPEFLELMISGNLEGQLRSMPGYQNVTIRDVERLGGNAGAYRVELSDGRRIFIKSEGLETTQFGARLLHAQGMVDMSPMLHTISFRTGAVDAQGTPVTREYGISEDIHGFAGQTVRIRLPDGRMDDVRVQSVAMVSNELFDPAAQQRILSNPQDPRYQAVRAFTDLARTPEGREQIFRAWSAYQELSRRAMVMDRHGRNTAMMVGQDSQGRPVVTFQPIDTDFVGGRISSSHDPSTPYETIRFDGDFVFADVGFIRSMQRMLSAGGTAVDERALAVEFLRSYSAGGLSNPPDVSGAMRGVLQEHDGRTFGLVHTWEVGAVNDEGGRPRVVVGENGQMIMHADEMGALADYLNSQPGRREALTHLLGFFRRQYNITDAEVRDLPGMYPAPPPIIRPPQ